MVIWSVVPVSTLSSVRVELAVKTTYSASLTPDWPHERLPEPSVVRAKVLVPSEEGQIYEMPLKVVVPETERVLKLVVVAVRESITAVCKVDVPTT